MSFRRYLTEHIKKYPQVQPQDIVKLCYQAAYGAEHLLADAQRARAYFEEEYERIPAREGELYERISDGTARIHLAAWKASGMSAEWLFRMFAASAEHASCDENQMEAYLCIADQVVRTEAAAFSLKEWNDYMEAYVERGMPAVHHSQLYRDRTHPSYRIVNTRYLCVLPILKEAARISGKEGVKIIALDGRAAAGKTTRAELLKKILGADIIHMDDFFLPPKLRNEERLLEPGGNVHYERFMGEVLPYLRLPNPFAYRIFRCGTMDYDGERAIGSEEWRIVEGSYSLHPKFGDYADLRVFCAVNEKEQMKRILNRNGQEMAEMFRTRWIPMEEAYFNEYDIQKHSDLCVMNEKSYCAKLKNLVG